MATVGNAFKISAAATSGMTVPTGAYVIATYAGPSGGSLSGPYTIYWGPGQTVAASTTISGNTFTFYSGVVFTNS